MTNKLAHRRWLMLATCSSAALILAQAAAAQDAGPTPLNEVVVTAQKRVENVQNVPEQISVVSSQFIDQIHATSLQDIGAYVPGLQVTPGGTPGLTTLGIRGIYPIASNVTVGTYVGDVPVGGSSLFSNAETFSLDLLPYDIASIQVLSGPQGTLYGADSLGGLLKYELTQPDLHAIHGDIGGDLFGVQHAGSPGGGGRASINGPIIDGQLGFTASYAYENTPGYIDDGQTGQKDQNGVRQQGARLGLLWTPSALPQLRVELNGLYQQIDADGLDQVALGGTTTRPVSGEYKDDNFVAQPFRKDIYILSDRTTYDFGFADLTSITSYEYTDVNQRVDATRIFGPLVTTPVADGGLGGPADTQVPEDEHIQLSKYTQETRLASKANSRFEWLIGSYVTYEHSSLEQDVPLLRPNGTPITPYLVEGVLHISSPLEVIQLPTIYREYAGFGDFTWHITPQLDLQAGVRYAYNAQDYKQVTTISYKGAAEEVGHSNDGVATFSVSPSYKFNRDLNVYLRFASGYQPGGPNVLIPGNTVPPTVAADTLTQYEIGVKSQFLDRRGTLDVAAFYNKWNNIQVSALDPVSETSFLENGGDAKTEGFDATGSFRVVPGLTVGGTFNYTYAAFTSVLPTQTLGIGVGSPLPQTPRFSGSVQTNYVHPLVRDWKYTLGADLRLQDFRYTAVNYFSGLTTPGGLFYREPGYGALDLNAGVQNDRYSLRLFAKNITDTYSYSNFNTLGGPQIEGVLIQPRTVGISVDAKF